MKRTRTKVTVLSERPSSAERETDTTVVYDVDDDSRWIATVPSMPGAIGRARTPEAAKRKALAAASGLQSGKAPVAPIEPPFRSSPIPWARQFALRAAHPSLLRLMADRPTGEGMNAAIRRGGIECGPGWLRIIGRLFRRIDRLTEKLPARRRPVVVQVKEKFGELRCYLHGAVADDVRDAVSAAIEESCRTCEICGASGRRRRRRNWYSTKCARCWRRDGSADRNRRLRRRKRLKMFELASALNNSERQRALDMERIAKRLVEPAAKAMQDIGRLREQAIYPALLSVNVDKSIARAIDAGESVADAVIRHKLSRLRKKPSIESWFTRRGNAAIDRWKILQYGLLGKAWATLDASAVIDVVRALDRSDRAPGNDLLNPWLYVVARAIVRMYSRSHAEELLVELREAVVRSAETRGSRSWMRHGQFRRAFRTTLKRYGAAFEMMAGTGAESLRSAKVTGRKIPGVIQTSTAAGTVADPIEKLREDPRHLPR